MDQKRYATVARGDDNGLSLRATTVMEHRLDYGGAEDRTISISLSSEARYHLGMLRVNFFCGVCFLGGCPALGI